MSGGLMTTSEVAAYFRVRPDDVIRMVQEDGLPAIELPGKTRPVRKFSAMALHGWVVRHSKGEPIGLEAFLREIAAVRGGEDRTDGTNGTNEGRAAA